MMTVLIETEGILNSRPLLYEGDEIDEPLTPSHLVIGRRLLDKPSLDFDQEDLNDNVSLTQRAKYLSRVLEHTKNRFQ